MPELTEMAKTAEDAAIDAVECDDNGESDLGWHRQVAVTIMIMAMLAAFGGLLTGYTANQALIERTERIIEMSLLEGDRVYVENLKSKHEILSAIGEAPDPAEIEMVRMLEGEVRELGAEAAREQVLVARSDSAHSVFAISVTLLTLGITLGGMAVIVERKYLWAAGLFLGVAGVVGIVLGIHTVLS